MNRVQTALLAMMTVSLAYVAIVGVPGNVNEARAQDGGTACETWVFDIDAGRKAGAANVDAHRVEMQARITRMMGSNGRTVYSNSFPIVNAINPTIVVAYSGVICIAK